MTPPRRMRSGGIGFVGAWYFVTEKKFKKDISSLGFIETFIRGFASEHSLDDEIVFTLNFVIEEIFTNMVKYQHVSGNDVSIALSKDGDTLSIRLIDYGVEYFDPTSAPAVDVNKPLSERRPGGLGVHLVKMYVDDFRYEYADENSIITLTKKLKD
jgi:serine/threonine-protein kinase RsbW